MNCTGSNRKVKRGQSKVNCSCKNNWEWMPNNKQQIYKIVYWSWLESKVILNINVNHNK